MMPDVIVHVGYGKTATTWLQEEIFKGIGTDIYLGKTESWFPSWLLRLNYLDDFAYDGAKSSLKSEFAALVAGRKKVIISSEAFTNFGAIFQQAARIKYVFDQPRIILVLRNPMSWLVSNYKYCVEYEGFSLPLESYLDFSERRTPFALEKRAPFYVPDLYYDEVVQRYRELFGTDNVLVARYEDFISDPTAFGSVLSEFVGLDLGDFATKAERKHLASKSVATIVEIRLENLRRYVLEAGYEATAIQPMAKPAEILSAQTQDRLRKLFAPHCAEYYPELSA